jgi:3-oxoacyl-[acyl-carrier-protein] synthase I
VSEAKGIFSIRDDGDGVKRSIELALKQAGLDPSDIGMVTAHGNGTPISDHGEALALAAIFGKKAVPVSCFKWALGHTLTAGGVLDTIMTLLSLKQSIVPGIASLTNPGSEEKLMALTPVSQAISKKTAAILSRGFASLDSCLIIRGAA